MMISAVIKSAKNGYLGQFSICLFLKAFLYSFIKYYSV